MVSVKRLRVSERWTSVRPCRLGDGVGQILLSLDGRLLLLLVRPRGNALFERLLIFLAGGSFRTSTRTRSEPYLPSGCVVTQTLGGYRRRKEDINPFYNVDRVLVLNNPPGVHGGGGDSMLVE